MGDYQVSGGIYRLYRFIWGVITRKLKHKSLSNWAHQTTYIYVIHIRISGGSREHDNETSGTGRAQERDSLWQRDTHERFYAT